MEKGCGGGGRGGLSRGAREEEGLEGWELNMGHLEQSVGTGGEQHGSLN